MAQRREEDRARAIQSQAAVPVAGVGFGDCNGYDLNMERYSHTLCPVNDIEGTQSESGRRVSLGTFGQDKYAGRKSVSSYVSAGGKCSIGSVAFVDEHWTAGKVAGDRVVEPRSAFTRAVYLMLNPKPKLEVLPTPRISSDSRSPLSRSSTDSRSQVYMDRTHSAFFNSASSLGHDNVLQHATYSSIGHHEIVTEAASGAHVSFKDWAPQPEKKQPILIDEISAMILPKLVPGLKIGPDCNIIHGDGSIRRGVRHDIR